MLSVGRKDKIIYLKKSLNNVVLCLLEGLRALFDMTYNYITAITYFYTLCSITSADTHTLCILFI